VSSHQFRLHERHDGPWGVRNGPWGMGECGIIDRDSIVPMQPETISIVMLQTLANIGKFIVGAALSQKS